MILAKRMSQLHGSPVREVLRVIDQPGMISFAGGLPAPGSFPTLKSPPAAAWMQYGATEGEEALRKWVAGDLQRRGLPVGAHQVLILAGSQQGIDLVAKLAVEAGTPVAVESPTYLAALQVFSLFGARYLPYTIDSVTADLQGQAPRLLYVNPTFQNPTSYVYSEAERRRLAALCDATDTLVFEDDPYHELAYEPGDRMPVCAHLEHAAWIYQSSFSKMLAPGLRLGYLACSPTLFPYLSQLKQAADLHSNRICQHMVLQALTDGTLPHHIDALRTRYREKRDCFDELAHRHLGELGHWEKPKGGMFFWLTLNSPEPIDTRRLLPQALSAGVAFMPGEHFHADGRAQAGQLRLNFSHADEAAMDKGLGILADLLRQAM